MRIFIKISLRIINIISFAAILLFVIVGIYDFIMGSAKTGDLLKKINSHWGYVGFIIAFVISILIFCLSLFFYEKWFGKS